jgi:tetratricopeptide (TPR) repeat protein
VVVGGGVEQILAAVGDDPAGCRWPLAGEPSLVAGLALAEAQLEQDRYGEAEESAHRVLRRLPVLGGAESSRWARLRVRALCVLGSALRCQGRYREAERLLDVALRLAERRLGSDDPAVVRSGNELAVLYKSTARFGEAEALYRRCLRIVVEAGRSESLVAATLWHNLGGLQHSRGRYALAEPAARRAVEIRSRILGGAHPAVAADRAALAAILDGQGETGEAEALLREALETFSRLGRRYEVAVNASNLAALRFRLGDEIEAQTLWERALGIKRELFGERHPELAATLVNLGVLAARRGDGCARSLFEQGLRMLGPEVGSEHPVRRAATASLAALGDHVADSGR